MFKYFLFILFVFLGQPFLHAQTRDELEKQRQQLKKEIEETQSLLNQNKAQTQQNLAQYNLINRKVDLQNQVISNISNDIDLLDGNMSQMYKDIRRYDKLLDTLKQEYAKSMVYAYKNRSNFDFINFIFSAGSFNDAIRRINYLRSYRNYREMQGQNIIRMQSLRKKKVDELNIVKGDKKTLLDSQSQEMSTLESERAEKDRIVADLQRRGFELNKVIAAKQKQIQKVNNAIAAAIKRAQEEARKEALAKAAAEKAKAAELAKKEKAKEKEDTKSKMDKPVKTTPKKESVLLNDENIALNASFERNKGSLPWPVDKGWVMMHYGSNSLPSGSIIENTSITISSEIGSNVKAVFDGMVSAIAQVDGMTVVIIQHGRYFSSYSNLNSVVVKKGDKISTGQLLGKVASNFEGGGSIDFFINNESNNYYDPEKWLRRK